MLIILFYHFPSFFEQFVVILLHKHIRIAVIRSVPYRLCCFLVNRFLSNLQSFLLVWWWRRRRKIVRIIWSSFLSSFWKFWTMDASERLLFEDVICFWVAQSHYNYTIWQMLGLIDLLRWFKNYLSDEELWNKSGKWKNHANRSKKLWYV